MDLLDVYEMYDFQFQYLSDEYLISYKKFIFIAVIFKKSIICLQVVMCNKK